MALHRKWINASAVLTIVTFAGPVLALAGSAAPYKPASTPPAVKQQFNNAAPASPPPPPPKQKVNNASGTATASGGAATQSGKPNTTTSTQTGPKPTVQSLMEAFRAAAAKGAPGNPKIQGGSSQTGSRNARLDQENAQAPSNQGDKPTVEMRKRQEQQRQQQLEQERLRRQRQLQLQQQAAKP